MTLKGFLFLFAVTLGAVASSAFISERLFDPGFERGIMIAVLSGLVVFPAARWAEYRGWIRGEWSPDGELRKRQEARSQRKARQAAAADGAADPDADAGPDVAASADSADRRDPPSNNKKPVSDGPHPTGRELPPGDSR